MKALIKKELREALVPAAFLFVPLCVTWFIAGERPKDVLLNPQQEPAAAVLATAGFAGLLIGYCQFAAERWRKTIGYVLHRGTSDGHVFVAKVIAGSCATACLAIGPPLVYTLVHLLTSDDRSIFQMQRVVEFAWLSTLGFSAYGLGTLVSQLHRAWWKEVLLGLVCSGALVLIAVGSTIMTPDDPAPHAVRFLTIQVAIGIVLLAVAFRLFVNRGDRDLPLPSAPHAVLALLGIMLFVFPLDLAATSAEHEWIRDIRSQYPVVLRERATGRVLAARPDERGDYVEVDAAGRRSAGATPLVWSGRGVEAQPYEFVYGPKWGASLDLDGSGGAATLNGRWVPLRFVDGGPVSTVAAANGQFIVDAYLDPHAGVIRVFFDEFTYGRVRVERRDVVLPRALPLGLVIEKPGGDRRFSGRTICLQPQATYRDRRRSTEDPLPIYRTLCAVDLDDRSMWRIDPMNLENPAREVSLPDNDRFVRLEMRGVIGEVRPSFFSYGYAVAVRDDTIVRHSDASPIVVAGERGLYTWNGDRFESTERDSSEAAAADLETAIDVRNSPGLESYADPLEPRIAVRSADEAEVLFSYDYAPRGMRAHITVGLIYMTNIVRSPLACVMSFFTTVPGGGPRVASGGWARVPLLYDGHRPLLLVVILALAFDSVRKVIKSLRQRGANGRTIGVWAAVTALFGVYAYLLFRVLEPRGKPLAAVVAPTTSSSPMLIQSRTREGAHAAGSV